MTTRKLSQLTNKQWLKIYKMYESGQDILVIANRYHVDGTLLDKVLKEVYK